MIVTESSLDNVNYCSSHHGSDLTDFVMMIVAVEMKYFISRYRYLLLLSRPKSS
jgi:hypothetical protein